MATQQSPQSLVVASRATLARASQNLQSGTSDPCRLLLGQPGLSLHYSGGHLQRSMPPREKRLSNLPSRIPNRRGVNATIPDCFVSGGRDAKYNWRTQIHSTNALSPHTTTPLIPPQLSA